MSWTACSSSSCRGGSFSAPTSNCRNPDAPVGDNFVLRGDCAEVLVQKNQCCQARGKGDCCWAGRNAVTLRIRCPETAAFRSSSQGQSRFYDPGFGPRDLSDLWSTDAPPGNFASSPPNAVLTSKSLCDPVGLVLWCGHLSRGGKTFVLSAEVVSGNDFGKLAGGAVLDDPVVCIDSDKIENSLTITMIF
jgi:hypothetical protein